MTSSEPIGIHELLTDDDLDQTLGPLWGLNLNAANSSSSGSGSSSNTTSVASVVAAAVAAPVVEPSKSPTPSVSIVKGVPPSSVAAPAAPVKVAAAPVAAVHIPAPQQVSSAHVPAPVVQPVAQQPFVSKLIGTVATSAPAQPPQQPVVQPQQQPVQTLQQQLPVQAQGGNPPPPGFGEGQWVYQDPSGKEQGPHPSSRMLSWFNVGYFPSTLLLKRVEWKAFVPLIQLLAASPYPPFSPMFAADRDHSVPLPVFTQQQQQQQAAAAAAQQQQLLLQQQLQLQQQQLHQYQMQQQHMQQQLHQQQQHQQQHQQHQQQQQQQQQQQFHHQPGQQQPGLLHQLFPVESSDVRFNPPASAIAQPVAAPSASISMYGKVRQSLAKSSESSTSKDVQSLLWGGGDSGSATSAGANASSDSR